MTTVDSSFDQQADQKDEQTEVVLKIPCRKCGDKFWFSEDEDPLCADCDQHEAWIYENMEEGDDDVQWDEEGRVIDWQDERDGQGNHKSYWPTNFEYDD
jgi:hypothetical protein